MKYHKLGHNNLEISVIGFWRKVKTLSLSPVPNAVAI